MPQSPQKPLPNPELNPLLNPTLGNNLGRWAQAYFTSPPEKREEAVLELLHELEAEAGAGDATRTNSGADPSWLHALEGAQLNPALSCAECGHKNAPQQRFCGMCGSRLVFIDPPVDADSTQLEQKSAPAELRSQNFSSQSVPSFGSPLSLFATAPSSDTDSGSDVQWLQEKGYGSDLGMEPERSSTKYWITALGVLLLGVLLYAQWKPQKGHSAAVNSPAPPPQTSTAQEKASQKSPEPSAQAPAQPTINTQEPAETQTSAKNETSSTQDSAPVAKNPPAETQAQSTPNDAKAPGAPQTQPSPVHNAATVQPENPTIAAGAAELATAEGYLTGKYGSRNSSEAARYLWKAVAKENPTAIMLLSNLYLAGDGVPKSCDQAKLLLRAGAQKNISEAANKLRELQRRGCP